MIRLIAILAFCVFAMPAWAETLKIFPRYQTVGKNPDGSKYAGSAELKVISDTTFSIVWKIEGSVYKGFGMRMNDTLAATYTLDGEPGLVIYKVLPDGKLDGLWAVKGQDRNGTETLTPDK